MKYLKKYNDLNESTFLLINSIIFSLLFLNGLIKNIIKQIKKTNNLKNYKNLIYKKLLSITININKMIKSEDIRILETINGYLIEDDNKRILITSEKIQANFSDFEMIIMPYDNYIKTNNIKYIIDDKKTINMLKNFMIDINEKLKKL